MVDKPQKIQIAEHIRVLWPQGVSDHKNCLNCNFGGSADRLVEIDYNPPGADHFYIVYTCSHCGAKFSNNLKTMDYSTDELIEIGWHTYQMQIGAGIWSIVSPLAQIDMPAGSKILEIGGAIGFGLDFGLRARNWKGVGYDPSGLAEFGARELGIDIKQDYFEEKDQATGPYDIVVATEVIEHLADPLGFLRLMRDAMSSDGLLLLTTPDACHLSPDLAGASLLPMLSPGAHLVLQTADSLRMVLVRAGFPYVQIKQIAMSLTAFASASPFNLIDDLDQTRKMYRRYLVERSQLADLDSDARFGFAGRGIFEAVNDSDHEAASAAWSALLPAAKQRFSIDLENMTTLPSSCSGASLSALAKIIPLGLGMIFYSRCMYLLATGHNRTDLLPLFQLSLSALEALQEALAQRSLIDGLSTDLLSAVSKEICLCHAASGSPDVIPSLSRFIKDHPSQKGAAWQALSELVNAGNFELALQIKTIFELEAPENDFSFEFKCNCLFALGILTLQLPQQWEYAAAIFMELRALITSRFPRHDEPGHLFWPTVRGEASALNYLERFDQVHQLIKQSVDQYAGAPLDIFDWSNNVQ